MGSGCVVRVRVDVLYAYGCVCVVCVRVSVCVCVCVCVCDHLVSKGLVVDSARMDLGVCGVRMGLSVCDHLGGARAGVCVYV